MMFVLFDKYKIKTKKKKAEVYSLLDILVETSEINYFKVAMGKESTFIGNVAPEGFKIAHTTRYHNTFYPIITGKFIECDKGTDINIVSRPPFIAAAIYTAIVYLIAIFLLNLSGWMLLGLLPLVYLSILFPYKYLTKKSKKELNTLLGDDF